MAQHAHASPMTAAAEESRTLETLEQMFATFHRRTGDLTTGCAVRVTGIHSTPVASLQRAVERLCEWAPVLRGCVVPNSEEGGADVLSSLSPGRLPSFQVVTQSGRDMHGWQAAFQEALGVSFEDGAPLFRFLIYHHPVDGTGSGASYLIITANHCVCDGRSLQLLCRHFLHLLTDEHAHLPSIPSTTSPISLAAHHTLDDLIPESDAGCAAATDSFQLDDPTHAGRRMRLLYRKLPYAEVSAMHAACRAHGVTMSTLLLAALSAALGPLTTAAAKDIMGVQCCVDLRRYFKADGRGAIGNLYSMPTFRVPTRKDGASSWADARAIYDRLLWYLDNKEGLHALHGDPAVNRAMAEKMSAAVIDNDDHGRHFYPGLSNLGVVDISPALSPSQGEGEVEEVVDGEEGGVAPGIAVSEFWFASKHARVGPVAMLCVASLVGEGMCLILNHPEPTVSRETGDQLMDRILGVLGTFQKG